MNEQVQTCINSYLCDNLSRERIDLFIANAPVFPFSELRTDAYAWVDYIPVNVRRVWHTLSRDMQFGISMMAMGALVGALGGPQLK